MLRVGSCSWEGQCSVDRWISVLWVDVFVMDWCIMGGWECVVGVCGRVCYVGGCECVVCGCVV